MLVFCACFYAYPQSEPTPFCGFPDDIGTDPSGVYSYATDQETLDGYGPIVFNIYFWQINDGNGNNPIPLTEENVLKSVRLLNWFYNDFNIFFKYHGFGEFNSEELYDMTIGEFFTIETNPLFQEYRKEDSFNIYVAQTTNFGGIASYKNTYMATSSSGILKDQIMIHEIGHCFGLAHTHNNHRTPNFCEHVTRNPADPEFNAYLNGDFVADTAAIPNLVLEHYWELRDMGYTHEEALEMYEPHKYVDITSCSYTGTGKDCQQPVGDPYEIFEDDIRNMMSYSQVECKDRISVGQAIRMRQTIDIDLNERFFEAETPVSSLYEPYRGEYYFAGPLPQNYEPPLFQPGFEYRFLECDCNCPAPLEYGNLSFSYTNNYVLFIEDDEDDFSIITHPNHSAIQIKHPDPVFYPQPQRCYDNMNLNPNGGSITKFNDGVINANVTITPKDSLGINNQYLIDNLMQGLYKIEKNYGDGSNSETVIYKGGNN